ncbi:hypothetical protein DM860_017180 [Cuscuta australis]|uniref:Uncharacterized protein n=1 Tax=Cuscuta australis TaxID=267555 RepID=A0A328DVC3_9ASTE|nr:hypothetical protein DM860_017180 [Cuscuta australis]
MRTISGGVVSMAPVSLSDAAAIITDFAASDTGASDAVSVYISRATDAFNHLVEFHNRCSQGHPGHVLRLKSLRNPDIVKKEEGEEEEPQRIPDGNHKSKKHKKKRDSDSRNGNLIKTEMNSVKIEERGEEKKNHSAEKVKIEKCVGGGAKEVSCAGKCHENNTEKKVKSGRSPADSVKKEKKQKSFSEANGGTRGEALVAETKKNHKKSGEGNGGSERDTFSVETKKRKGEEVEADLHSSKRRKSRKG